MPDPSIRQLMQTLHRAPEQEVLLPLLDKAELSAAERAAVTARARALISRLRAAQDGGWVNRFLQQYRLGTSEGTALLSLAEAFLRVPDADTQALLIADRLGDADWSAHAGASDSGLVNGATWGLMLGKAVMGEGERSSTLRRLIARAGEPFVRQAVGGAMRMMGQLFVMGRTIEEATARMARTDHRGFTASFDMLGEAARTHADAEAYLDAYAHAIAVTGRNPAAGHSISVKLSALHPRYEPAQADRVLPLLAERVGALAVAAAGAGIDLTIDAEESARLDLSLDIIAAVAGLPALKGWDGLGMAVQAYGKRAGAVIAWADALGRSTGRIVQLRLVKGAYWDSEIKHTQERGLPDYPLFTRKRATDVSYLACVRDLLAARHLRPAFASHNAMTVATICEWAGDRRDFEFQRLHGMGDGLFEHMVREEGYHCRIYAPVGGHRELLAYLVRRLLENGANSSFVHQLTDAAIGEDALLADPVERLRAVGVTPNPSIPLPVNLFRPERANSAGMDLEDRTRLQAVARAIRTVPAAAPPPVGPVAATVARAIAAAPAWAATPVAQRAECLDRLANLLENEREALMALCVDEARKTIPDALAEVREAADFCRYYAARARIDLLPTDLPGPTGEQNRLRLAPRGVWACIAPWNFPLAIFLGQVAAALVTGNAVVAKPAPQTPRIGLKAVELAHRAGIPTDVLTIVTGGADTGSALVGDARIAGVAFTGSVATARTIARRLLEDDSRPLVPLIAETGGINAMIVDSTALTEQVVRDIVISGFQSAGQRCSALRLLLLQDDIAEATLAMLSGAMDTLVVGDPADPATDIGPVIDRHAHERLMAYLAAAGDRVLKSVPVPPEGLFVPPSVVRIGRIEDLDREWFGPIVHVATFAAGTIEATVQRVNALGYGLTMGLHSRIARVADRVEALAAVGNLYINRSMIGAVVGSQPFGGEGLSGTGPKAGGPHYLPRFCVERTVSIDTTSAGGNASLLSLEEGL